MPMSPKISWESLRRFGVSVNVIPLSPGGLDVERRPGAVSQLFADVLDVDHDGIVAYRVVLPDGLIDMFQREDLLFVPGQQLQNLELRVGQPYGFAAPENTLAVQVQNQVGNGNLIIWSLGSVNSYLTGTKYQ